jgi:hypothetical protein
LRAVRPAPVPAYVSKRQRLCLHTSADVSCFSTKHRSASASACRHVRYSVYLLYWYKSANTDASSCSASACACTAAVARVLRRSTGTKVIAHRYRITCLLVQECPLNNPAFWYKSTCVLVQKCLLTGTCASLAAAMRASVSSRLRSLAASSCLRCSSRAA